ncbi:hypothetical protein HPB52_024240 [Rhipicephalus sanguineus]|uniref:Secreted protein n=1 Tax=Rhipicephalus sanguineus TaxID=34632 RepID=A0A9D4YRD7_RHISA|nr:hypothetical protein HPB52_024240 [Rhipicephalus sanguineus]
MKQITSLLCLVGCLAICACSFEPDNHQQALDVANDQESHSPSMEAIQVGEALRAISQGLRDTAQISEQAGYEIDEYFVGKLVEYLKKIVEDINKSLDQGEQVSYDHGKDKLPLPSLKRPADIRPRNDQSRSLGVEAIQVGEVLRAISQKIRMICNNQSKQSTRPRPSVSKRCDAAWLNFSDGEEYFIKKLWNKAKNAVKQVGKVVEKTAKGVITSKAADIVKKFLQDKLGAYALEETRHTGFPPGPCR